MNIMGRILRHKLNEGAQISRNGSVIDVVVRLLDSTPGKEWASLEVRGVPGKEALDIGVSEGYVNLGKGLRVGIVLDNQDRNAVRVEYHRYRRSDIEPKKYKPVVDGLEVRV